MNEQKCLEYIQNYREKALTKYDFSLKFFASDLLLPKWYAILDTGYVCGRTIEIKKSGCSPREALNNLIAYLELPTCYIYRKLELTEGDAA